MILADGAAPVAPFPPSDLQSIRPVTRPAFLVSGDVSMSAHIIHDTAPSAH